MGVFTLYTVQRMQNSSHNLKPKLIIIIFIYVTLLIHAKASINQLDGKGYELCVGILYRPKLGTTILI